MNLIDTTEFGLDLFVCTSIRPDWYNLQILRQQNGITDKSEHWFSLINLNKKNAK
jgi:hypothetical protein